MPGTGHPHLTPDELAQEEAEQITFPQARARLQNPCAFWLLTPRGDIIASNLIATWLWGESQLNSRTFFGVNVFEIFSRHRQRIPRDRNNEFFRKKIPILLRLVEGFGIEHYKSFVDYLRIYPDLKRLFDEQKYIPDEIWNSKRIWEYSLTLTPPKGTREVEFLDLQVTVYRLLPNNEFLGVYEPHPRSPITQDIFAQKFSEALAIADAGLLEYVQYLDGIKQGGDLTIKKERKPAGGNQLMKEDASKVISALEDPRYNWRTIEGVVRDTALPLEEVNQIMGTIDDQVVQTRRKPFGTIYTTRRHYRQNEPLVNRVLSVLAGRII